MYRSLNLQRKRQCRLLFFKTDTFLQEHQTISLCSDSFCLWSPWKYKVSFTFGVRLCRGFNPCPSNQKPMTSKLDLLHLVYACCITNLDHHLNYVWLSITVLYQRVVKLLTHPLWLLTLLIICNIRLRTHFCGQD